MRAPTFAALAVSFICALLFLPAVRYGFVNYDDPLYVLDNPLIRQLDGTTLAQAFLQSHLGWWMPLTWLSLAVDYQFWGLNPAGYHLTNLLLHALNAGLVVLIADELLKKWRPGESGLEGEGGGYPYFWVLLLAGLFFGAHPLRVESVAWVTERKDVLNGLFTVTSVLFYLKFAARKVAGAAGGRTGGFLLLSLLFFVCSLMSKSTSVVLPVVFLVLDWVPLGRLKESSLLRLVKEKWPFWAASALMVLFTVFFAARSAYLVTYEAFPLDQRMVVSGNAVWEYLRMTLFPVGLNPLNVIPDPIPAAYTVKTVLVAAGFAMLGIAAWRGKGHWLAATAIGFLLPLLPVLAFFQNGDQSYADRFTYLPSLAPALLAAFLLCRGICPPGAGRRRTPAIVAALAVMLLFMAGTVRQLQVWQSSETFWNRVVALQPLAITYKERGRYYLGAGRYDAAVADFTAALAMITPTLKPYEYNFYGFRGEALRGAGRFEDAVRDFSTAIGQHPHPAYYWHRGLALKAMGRAAEAEEDFRRAGPDRLAIGWFD